MASGLQSPTLSNPKKIEEHTLKFPLPPEVERIFKQTVRREEKCAGREFGMVSDREGY